MIRTQIKNKVGIIYLDRPEKLNALNLEMINDIEATLKSWENDDQIRLVLFDSETKSGLCAGGDVKAVYDEIIADKFDPKNNFFATESDLCEYVEAYKKPVISHWYGIIMGGGVGLTINSDLIIVDETVNWAMPETRLGFIPDVGSCQYISTLPQAVGQYTGLLGQSLGASDLIKYEFADIFIGSGSYDTLMDEIIDLSSDYEGDILIEEIKKASKKYENREKVSKIDHKIDDIYKYFSYDSLEQIYDGLKDNLDDDFARKSFELFNERSPFMLKTQFEKYFLCKKLTYKEIMALDLKILNYGQKIGSMSEGIRSLIIGKDYKAQWPNKSINDVDETEVKALLEID